jgi:60 kDa SS-A/Ro ribonucleoprotein
MSKFNKASAFTGKTKNFAGGEAFKESAKIELVSLLLTSFVQEQFYRTEKQTVDRLYDLIERLPDKSFAAKAAIYARNEFGMRSISHLVAAVLAFGVKKETWTKSFFEKVVRRPDDITEILACYMANFGKPVPNALKKGLAAAFSKFDGYQLGKYRGEGRELSLVDAVNILHPTPTEKNREALKALVKGDLRSTETWETKLTQAGQKAAASELNADEALELKKEAWSGLIRSRKLGYFALLRNLRNILEVAEKDKALLSDALEMLVDSKLIHNALVLPFRFMTALDEIEKTNYAGSRRVVEALSKAADIALENVPTFDGKTLVVLDVSGSMVGRPAAIGSLFSAILVKANQADFMTFSDSADYRTLNTKDATLTIARNMRFASGGTNFHAIFQKANKAYDRVIILSDMQGWIGNYSPAVPFADYCKRTNATPHIYSFDLQGYGTLQFPEKKVYAIAGFSEKILDVMKLLEQDRNALVNTVESVPL